MEAEPHSLSIPSHRLRLTGAFGIVWAICLTNWMWIQLDWQVVTWCQAIVFAASLPISIAWIRWARSPKQRHPITLCIVLTIAFVFLWQLSVFSYDLAEWDIARTQLARVGTAALFFVGLAWIVWGVERASQQFESQRQAARAEMPIVLDPNTEAQAFDQATDQRSNHPLDPEAWYYGGHTPKLNQSVAALASYSIAFKLMFLVFTQMGGCRELYEMPAGGGQQQTISQTVKVQKVIKKKYVINPFSAISFKVPPIDEVKLQLTEITKHAYTVGYGQGAGAGFAGGTKQGQGAQT